jgi:uncharacterized protein YkwD
MIIAIWFLSFFVQQPSTPLSTFSSEWNNKRYQLCNTAENAPYLNRAEREIIYILNMARVNPALFLETIIKNYPAFSEQPELANSSYYKSLLTFLQQQKPLPLLYPDERLFESARCHAISAGKEGYAGHDRISQQCKGQENFLGECCFYGSSDPLEIIIDLMIDEDVPSLGHRTILFKNFTKIGVSLQPHKKYRWNAVLDFAR